MAYYIGMDVSQRQTSICVVDDDSKIIAEGKALTLPSDIYDWLKNRIETQQIHMAGIEAGAMSNWLCMELSKLGLPIICLESFQAHQFLKTQRNKTDKNDARGLAQMVRMGGAFIKSVNIRSEGNQSTRMLLTVRQNLVRLKLSLENNITGSLKPFGLIVPRSNACAKKFRERVIIALHQAEERGIKIQASMMPSLNLYDILCGQLFLLNKQVEALAKSCPICRRLMTVPGVGSIIALSFVTSVDNPHRFKKSGDIGAYFGLTPRQYQSGEMDIRGGTSRRGDVMTRTHLVQAATVLLFKTKKWCALKAWGMKIAKRHGMVKARIAVARKLATILHKMWITQKDFCWSASVSADTLLAGTKPA